MTSFVAWATLRMHAPIPRDGGIGQMQVSPAGPEDAISTDLGEGLAGDPAGRRWASDSDAASTADLLVIVALLRAAARQLQESLEAGGATRLLSSAQDLADCAMWFADLVVDAQTPAAPRGVAQGLKAWRDAERRLAAAEPASIDAAAAASEIVAARREVRARMGSLIRGGEQLRPRTSSPGPQRATSHDAASGVAASRPSGGGTPEPNPDSGSTVEVELSAARERLARAVDNVQTLGLRQWADTETRRQIIELAHRIEASSVDLVRRVEWQASASLGAG